MPSVDPEQILPSLEAIGSRIMTLTRTSHGQLLGTFTSDTRPTAEEAQAEALRAARFVAGRMGQPSVELSRELLALARDAAADRAALLIATGWYGDASDPDDARLDQLGRVAREQLDALLAAVRDDQPGGRRFHSIRVRTR